MLDSYVTQFGIILFPIFLYQIFVYRKSFNAIPHRTLVMGIYGGLTSILCQVTPVHIFGQPENFQCIPVILSILYGKRRAGLLGIGILIGYQIITVHNSLSLFGNTFAILIYSSIPLAVCTKFDRYHRRKKLFVAFALSIVTLIVELLYLVAYFFLAFGTEGLNKLSHYYSFLGVASIIQLAFMTGAFFLLESIMENGRMRNRFQTFIDHNPLGICSYGLDQRIIAMNAAYEMITGYKESELLGRTRLDLWFAEDHDFAQETLDSVLRGELIKDIEAVIRHKDGYPVQVRFTMIPVLEEDRPVGYLAMVNDITDSKVAEEALRNSEKLSAIGQLAAGIAHEIRNPLTSLKGFLKLIPNAEDSQRYVGIMQDELTRIELIVSELLVLAKPQATQFSVRDIRQKLHDVLHLLNGQAAMKSITLCTEFEENVPPIECEPNQLKQVFINITKNAIEATSSGGTVTMELKSHHGTHIMVRIRDTGVGIPKDTLARLGDPFFTTKASGTGLGLMVCKKIIANHHGDLDITSEVGTGTTVSIVLPYKQPQRSYNKQSDIPTMDDTSAASNMFQAIPFGPA